MPARPRTSLVFARLFGSGFAGLGYFHCWLASAFAFKGETERAAVELADAWRLSGNGSPSSIAEARASAARYFVAPAIRSLLETTYIVGLRKAGVPEE